MKIEEEEMLHNTFYMPITLIPKSGKDIIRKTL